MAQLDSRARRDSVALALQDATWATGNKPPSGFGYLIKDAADGHIKLFLSDGTKVDLQTGGGGGSGTVTSVAPTAGAPGSLFAAGGTPTVAPTYGFAAQGAAGLLGALSATTPSVLAPQQINTLLVKEYYATVSGAAATSLLLSGLDGDTDGLYYVRIFAKSAVGANNIKIQVNGADTNLRCMVGDRGHGSVARSDWQFGYFGANPAAFSANDFVNLTGFFYVRSGRVREISVAGYAQLPGGVGNGVELLGEYNDTATNVTSMGIVASVASGLAIGSMIYACRVQTTNPLA